MASDAVLCVLCASVVNPPSGEPSMAGDDWIDSRVRVDVELTRISHQHRERGLNVLKRAFWRLRADGWRTCSEAPRPPRVVSARGEGEKVTLRRKAKPTFHCPGQSRSEARHTASWEM